MMIAARLDTVPVEIVRHICSYLQPSSVDPRIPRHDDRHPASEDRQDLSRLSRVCWRLREVVLPLVFHRITAITPRKLRGRPSWGGESCGACGGPRFNNYTVTSLPSLLRAVLSNPHGVGSLINEAVLEKHHDTCLMPPSLKKKDLDLFASAGAALGISFNGQMRKLETAVLKRQIIEEEDGKHLVFRFGLYIPRSEWDILPETTGTYRWMSEMLLVYCGMLGLRRFEYRVKQDWACEKDSEQAEEGNLPPLELLLSARGPVFPHLQKVKIVHVKNVERVLAGLVVQAPNLVTLHLDNVMSDPEHDWTPPTVYVSDGNTGTRGFENLANLVLENVELSGNHLKSIATSFLSSGSLRYLRYTGVFREKVEFGYCAPSQVIDALRASEAIRTSLRRLELDSLHFSWRIKLINDPPLHVPAGTEPQSAGLIKASSGQGKGLSDFTALEHLVVAARSLWEHYGPFDPRFRFPHHLEKSDSLLVGGLGLGGGGGDNNNSNSTATSYKKTLPDSLKTLTVSGALNDILKEELMAFAVARRKSMDKTAHNKGGCMGGTRILCPKLETVNCYYYPNNGSYVDIKMEKMVPLREELAGQGVELNVSNDREHTCIRIGNGEELPTYVGEGLY